MIEKNRKNIKSIVSILIFSMIFLNLFSNSTFSKKIDTDEVKNCDALSGFSWRNINDVDFTTPVKNQEFCKSDASFALVACLETKVQYAIGYPFYCDLSEAYLFFNCLGTCNNGVNISVCADYLKNYGVPDEGCFPYPERYCSVPDYTNISDWNDRSVKVNDWGWVPNDIESIKEAIVQYGPVCALINYSLSFANYKSGIYEPKGKNIGVQWISIVGYDDNQRYWICKNSWGEEWGEYGFFKIPYNSNMITNGRYLNSDNIPNDCTGVLFLNGTIGSLKTDVPIVKIFQPSRGFIYFGTAHFKRRVFDSKFFTERFIYITRNGLLNKIFKKGFEDIRTPWIINSCIVEVCALRYKGNASVYIDGELKYNFSQTTLLVYPKFDTPGLHTLKAVAYNEKGDESFDVRDFLVI